MSEIRVYVPEGIIGVDLTKGGFEEPEEEISWIEGEIRKYELTKIVAYLIAQGLVPEGGSAQLIEREGLDKTIVKIDDKLFELMESDDDGGIYLN